MTELLNQAFKAAQALSDAQQDALARDLLARLALQTGLAAHRPALGRIRAIAARCSKRPVLDSRSADEIIGYDEFGLPN